MSAKISICIAMHINVKKSNLQYTCGITQERVTSSGVHLRSLAPVQHSSEDTLQRNVVGLKFQICLKIKT